MKDLTVDCHFLVRLLAQHSILLSTTNLLLLLGRSGSGKTTLATCLATHHDFEHVEMSTVAKDLRHQRGFDQVSLRRFVESIRRKDSSDDVIKRAHSLGLLDKRKVVISGIRHPKEIHYIESVVRHDRILTVYVQCGFFTRLLRIMHRPDRFSVWNFVLDEYDSLRWGDLKLKELASVVFDSVSGMIRSNHNWQVSDR